MTISSYKGRMKTFINEYLDKNKNIPNEKIIEFESLIDNVSETIIEVYSENAFKRINEEGTYEGNLNRAIMDILFISTSILDRDKIIKNKEKIFNRYKELINNDKEFRNSLTISTSDTNPLNYRIKRWIEEVKNIINE